MTVRHDRLDALAMGLMILLCVTWGLNQVAAKVANDSISPLLQAGLRSAGATVLVWGWSALRGTRLFARDGSLWPGLAAGLLFAAEFGIIFWALTLTTASRGVIFLYTAPFSVAIGLHWLVPAERLGPWQVLGLVCAFLGVVAAFAESLGMPSGRQWIGDAAMLVAAILWGATTVLVRASRLATISPSKTLLYQLAFSAVTLPLASLAFGEAGFSHPTAIGLLSLAWQIVIVAFASYLGWFWLISRYPATRLSGFSFLTPLFGMIAGALLLDEPVTKTLALAMLLVAVGLWLINRRPAARSAAAIDAAEPAGE